jgi:hypothetical protein
MRKYAQYAAAIAGALVLLAVILWANRSGIDQCRKSQLPYSAFCDQIAKQFTTG